MDTGDFTNNRFFIYGDVKWLFCDLVRLFNVSAKRRIAVKVTYSLLTFRNSVEFIYS